MPTLGGEATRRRLPLVTHSDIVGALGRAIDTLVHGPTNTHQLG